MYKEYFDKKYQAEIQLQFDAALTENQVREMEEEEQEEDYVDEEDVDYDEYDDYYDDDDK